jgi:hypothetical protein
LNTVLTVLYPSVRGYIQVKICEMMRGDYVASSRKNGDKRANDETCSEVLRRGKSVSVICKRTKLPVIFSDG